jgi:hypothetical protein
MVTRLDIPADRVLDGATGRCPDGVVVIGYDRVGDVYFASSIADGGTVLLLLERLKLKLLDVADQ